MHFKLNPSQWINTGWVLFGIIGFPLVIPPLIALYQLVHVYRWRYEFYDDLIIQQKGVFDVTRTELNLHRVKSVRLHQPFFYRFFNLSIIQIVSSDPLNPYMELVAVPYGEILIESLKEEVEMSRQRKGIKESDIHIL
jgi:uncharacterized membrane protein YdbT with pleckstrin-like domain